MKDFIVEKVYDYNKVPYQKWFKKQQPWPIDRTILLRYDEQSLGFHLGFFLLKHDFELQVQFEDHVVIHVLTKTGISVIEEIGLQFYMFGNGKRSLYLFFGVILGSIFYANKLCFFKKQFVRGKKAQPFFHYDFFKMLTARTEELQFSFGIV